MRNRDFLQLWAAESITKAVGSLRGLPAEAAWSLATETARAAP